jgi:hypothetical protein
LEDGNVLSANLTHLPHVELGVVVDAMLLLETMLVGIRHLFLVEICFLRWKTDASFLVEMTIQMEQIQKVIDTWYGVRDMPITIRTREEEAREFELANPEFPQQVWHLVNHNARLFRMWLREDLDLDLVVWEDTTQSYRMIQEVCFKDAYPTSVDWHQAVQSLIRSSERLWVVYHRG